MIFCNIAVRPGDHAPFLEFTKIPWDLAGLLFHASQPATCLRLLKSHINLHYWSAAYITLNSCVHSSLILSIIHSFTPLSFHHSSPPPFVKYNHLISLKFYYSPYLMLPLFVLPRRNKPSPMFVHMPAQEEGLLKLWQGATPAIYRHLGRSISLNRPSKPH